MINFADRLFEKTRSVNSVLCIGLDPHIEFIPPEFKKFGEEEALLNFSMGILESFHRLVPAIKFQIAFYERLGSIGYSVLEKVIKRARELEIITIIDCKRGDIGTTARQYARAYFEEKSPLECDAVTLNPYLGYDSMKPFFSYLSEGKGAFILVKTSNPSSSDIQDLKVNNNHRIYEIVGNKISEWGREYIGSRGYSSLGAVVGCTHPDELTILRQELPDTLFLVPGYGAQGGMDDDVALAFDRNSGYGGLVCASRSIIFAYRDYKDKINYLDAAHTAYRKAVKNINIAINKRIAG